MKKMNGYLFLSVLILICSYSVAQGNMKFVSEVHDFGDIPEGPPVSHTFEFVNTGDQPLIITNASPSCGCTTPDWTKTPVPPKGKGFIKATYNTEGRPGSFNKSITITSNGIEPTKVIFIKGNVIPKSQNSTNK